MLTEIQYVEQQRSLGHRIHQQDGVYWEEVYPFYCKPAFIYKAFDPGTSRPARVRRLLGYSHQVVTPELGNRRLPVMVLGRNSLDGFDLLKLPSKKRNNVRRALDQCVVKPITDIEAHLERILEINVSQAIRHEKGAGAETPVRRYTEESDQWRRQMRGEFALVDREWWGAFVDGQLTAYLRTYQVDDIRVIQQAKADTACLRFYPMDALYYTVLSQAAGDPLCRMIVNGRPQHPSLNHYKEQFLFKADEFSYFSTHAGLVEIGKRLVFGVSGLRQSMSLKLSRSSSTARSGKEPI